MRTLLTIALALLVTSSCRAPNAPIYADGTRVALDYVFELGNDNKQYEKVGALANRRLQRALHNNRYAFETLAGRSEHVPDAERFLLVATLATYYSGHPREVVLRAEIFRGGAEEPLWKHDYRAYSRGWDRAAYAAVDDLVVGISDAFARIEEGKLLGD